MNANLYYKVVYRDPHFNSEKYYGKYLEKIKRFCIEKAGMNIFTFNSTEKALKFIINAKKEKESDKFIFVTSIGKDKSGKRYIEIVRKILNFDVMVLFYSNNTDHFSWIKDFPNCLYTHKPDIFEKYITNYNINGLLNLKKEVEKKYEKYNLKLKDFYLFSVKSFSSLGKTIFVSSNILKFGISTISSVLFCIFSIINFL